MLISGMANIKYYIKYAKEGIPISWQNGGNNDRPSHKQNVNKIPGEWK